MTVGFGDDRPAWELLTSMPAWEVTELPRADELDQGDAAERVKRDRELRALTLASACQSGSPVGFGWIRAQAPGTVRLIVAGEAARIEGRDSSPLPGVAETGQQLVPLGYPAGAAGRELHPGDLGRACSALPSWAALLVTSDALLDQSDSIEGRVSSLEDDLMRAWHGPFGVVVVARPTRERRRLDLLHQVTDEHLIAGTGESPEAQVAMRRAQTRHDELRTAAATGLWDIWMLAGGTTPTAAIRVAQLVSAVIDLASFPYALTADRRAGPLPLLLGATAAGICDHRPQPRLGTVRPSPRSGPGHETDPDFPDPSPEFPCVASSRVLAALAVPPAKEVPGIRFTLKADFDVTPEASAEPGTGIELGRVLDANRVPSAPLKVSQASLNRHTFVCGATGSQVPDHPASPGVSDGRGHPLARHRAGQGRVQADGRPSSADERGGSPSR